MLRHAHLGRNVARRFENLGFRLKTLKPNEPYFRMKAKLAENKFSIMTARLFNLTPATILLRARHEKSSKDADRGEPTKSPREFSVTPATLVHHSNAGA